MNKVNEKPHLPFDELSSNKFMNFNEKVNESLWNKLMKVHENILMKVHEQG